MARLEKRGRMLGSDESHAIPEKAVVAVPCDAVSSPPAGYVIPVRRKQADRVRLTGYTARKSHDVSGGERTLWDTELVGFGLRLRKKTGIGGSWIVRFRSRDELKRVTLGRTEDMDVSVARKLARDRLAAVALDGLPKRPKAPVALTFAAYYDEFWRDYERHWKPLTRVSNRGICRRQLLPNFGKSNVADIVKSDIVRWRDSLAGTGEAVFNRAVPVLSVMMKYAEQLGYRRKGSNPCRGIPRYKRELPERYLTPAEYRRLARVLDEDESKRPNDVAIIRLLLFTGARSGEITGLKWRHVQPSRLMLSDSKTGAKIVYLNSQAEAVLASLERRKSGDWVFPNLTGTKPRNVDYYWTAARKRAAIPDVRIHDLRHSFASTAVMNKVAFATVGKLLGHVLPETTARYAHLADEVVADAAGRVSGLLARHLGLGR